MCAGRRRSDNVKQPFDVRLLRWPCKINMQVLSDGNNVEAPTVHWHAHVLRTDNAPVHEVPSILQRCAYLVELLAVVNPQGVGDVLENDNLGAFEVDIP